MASLAVVSAALLHGSAPSGGLFLRAQILQTPICPRCGVTDIRMQAPGELLKELKVILDDVWSAREGAPIREEAPPDDLAKELQALDNVDAWASRPAAAGDTQVDAENSDKTVDDNDDADAAAEAAAIANAQEAKTKTELQAAADAARDTGVAAVAARAAVVAAAATAGLTESCVPRPLLLARARAEAAAAAAEAALEDAVEAASLAAVESRMAELDVGTAAPTSTARAAAMPRPAGQAPSAARTEADPLVRKARAVDYYVNSELRRLGSPLAYEDGLLRGDAVADGEKKNQDERTLLDGFSDSSFSLLLAVFVLTLLADLPVQVPALA